MSTLSQILSSAKAASPDRPIPQPVADLWEDVRAGYTEELGPHERTALQSWLGFSASFCTARGIAHAIKDQAGPFRNVSIGGVHLHHYMWGIGLLAVAGAVAIHGPAKWRRSPAVAIAYGVGLGLIADEFALLTDLEDVYWSKQGRLSVEVGVSLIAAGGTVLTALPILQRVARRYRA